MLAVLTFAIGAAFGVWVGWTARSNRVPAEAWRARQDGRVEGYRRGVRDMTAVPDLHAERARWKERGRR